MFVALSSNVLCKETLVQLIKQFFGSHVKFIRKEVVGDSADRVSNNLGSKPSLSLLKGYLNNKIS